MNFRNLDDLIRSGIKKIVLNSDVVLDDEEVDDYPEGIVLDVENIVIDGDGHTIDANGKTMIFKVKGDNVTITNVTFRGGFGDGYQKGGGAILNLGKLTLVDCIFRANNVKEVGGGAIVNSNSLTLTNCKFYNNNSEGDCYAEGGAILTSGLLSLTQCIFENNMAEKSGGAIYNVLDSQLNVEDCTFENNSVKKNGFFIFGKGGAISNHGKTTCTGSTFINNLSSEGRSIFNFGELSIFKSKFLSSSSSSDIHQVDEDATIQIEYSKSRGKIQIDEGSCTVKKSKFCDAEDFNIHNEGGILTCIIEASDFTSIYNNNIINIPKDIEFENRIQKGANSIIRYIDKGPDDDFRGFDYLNSIIMKCQSSLLLDCDITFHPTEQNFFEGGIELSKDIVIDGNGHTIDAANMSRVFFIMGVNVVLKNIIFKNGRYFKSFFDTSKNGGGAILALPGSSLTIENCEFTDNTSRESAGAISNKGNPMKIIGTTFTNNSCRDSGGCVDSNSNLDIIDCSFNDNFSRYNGAVVASSGELKILESTFDNCRGGAVMHFGSMRMKDSRFKNNHGNEGGAISTFNIICMDNCIFENNSSNQDGGAIECENILDLRNSVFKSNQAEYGNGGAICYRGDAKIEKCKFEFNKSVYGLGGAIHVQRGQLDINECDFKRNSSRWGAGAVHANKFKPDKGVCHNIANCSFKSNSTSNGTVYNNCIMKLRNCIFDNYQNVCNEGNVNILAGEKETLIGCIENEANGNITIDER